MYSWKEFHTHPEFCPVFVKNAWWDAEDIVTTTVTDTDAKGHTLLHLAVFGLRVKDVTDLLARGADVNAVTTYGFKPHQMLMTPILMSDARCSKTKDTITAIITMLIEHGAIDTPVFEDGIDEVVSVGFATYMDKHQMVKRKTDAFCISDLVRSIKCSA
jgi:ankyrin repeat protein